MSLFDDRAFLYSKTRHVTRALTGMRIFECLQRRNDTIQTNFAAEKGKHVKCEAKKFQVTIT